MADKYLIYQVKVGKTPAFYDDCTASVDRYCSRFGISHIVQTEPVLGIVPVKSARSANALVLGYLPVYEKEAALAYFDEYDKILILDADVYIKELAPNIFLESETEFAGVVEREIPINAAYIDKIRKYSDGMFRPLSDVDWKWDDSGAEFFNMGVMLLDKSITKYLKGQTPGQFLRRPEFERFVNGELYWRWSTDQILLNWWLKAEKIATKHLDWRWNALYGSGADVSKAFFVHFFLSAKMPRKGAEIPDIIRGL